MAEREISIDTQWENFISQFKPQHEDFISLLQDKLIKKEFQERALQIMLSPNLKDLPFATIPNQETNNGNYLPSQEFIGYDPEKWVAQLTKPQTIKAAKIIQTHLAKLRSEQMNPQVHRAIEALNNYIPNLLPTLPQEKAQEMFNILDIKTAFWKLYSNSQIPESFKKEASAKIHLEAQNAPTEESMIIQLGNYGHNLMEIALNKIRPGLPFSKSFFQEEMQYILKTIPKDKRIGIGQTRSVDIYEVSNYLDSQTRREFTKRQFLGKYWDGGEREFEPSYNKNEELEILSNLTKDYQDDEELVNYLNDKIKLIQEIINQEKIKKEDSSQTKKEIYNALKK